MKIRPLGDRALVVRIDDKEKQHGGIMPDLKFRCTLSDAKKERRSSTKMENSKVHLRSL